MDRVSNFGLAVRKRRLQCKLSQEKLAELAGLHRNLIGLIERGKINASIESIYSICDALGTCPSMLFSEAEKIRTKSQPKSKT
ncbi:MAG TPA: helix-turn-helix domain-containing protein [Pseudomonadales bacterium]|nr:helix-turn-helix domain-containing protein [Pseudomonadales bacterium]